jgi:F-type H+-transporting ATPase subunit a
MALPVSGNHTPHRSGLQRGSHVRNWKVWFTVGAVLVLLLAGFILDKGPQPDISLKPETVFAIGPFQVTNTIITAYVVMAVLGIATWLATRKASLIPSGFYNFVEAAVEWLLSMVEETAGAGLARKFFIPVTTFFLFIICSNYFGLLPIVNSIGEVHRSPTQVEESTGNAKKTLNQFTDHGGIYTVDTKEYKEGAAVPSADELKAKGKVVGESHPWFRSPMTDVNSPLALALWSFVFVEFWGLSALGIHYLGKFLAFPPFARKADPIGIFVGGLETLSELIRIISFTFRLFGNIFAGDVLILFMSFLAPFLLPVIFYGLETFVGFIQAAVFALLTLVFAVMAVESHDEEEHGAQEAHGAHAEAATH